VRGASGRVLTAADTEVPSVIESLNARGTYSAQAAALSLDHVGATIGPTAIELTARLPVGSEGDAHLEGSLTPVRVADITRFWPIKSAERVREWISRNIHGGMVPGCDFKIRIPPPTEPGRPRTTGNDINVAFSL